MGLFKKVKKFFSELCEPMPPKHNPILDDRVAIEPVKIDGFHLPERTPSISTYRICETLSKDDSMKHYEVQLFDNDTKCWYGTRLFHTNIENAKKDGERLLQNAKRMMGKVVYISDNNNENNQS